MSADAGVIAAACRDVKVQVRLPVLAGDVPGKVGDFHLFGKSLVDVLVRRRVEVTECCLRDRPEAGYAPRSDIFFFTEGRKRLCYSDVIVKTEDEHAFSDFFRLVHSIIIPNVYRQGPCP